MNIIDDLLGFYNATPEGDIYHEAIRHLMENPTHVRNATIYQMADMCYVSPSTISRATAVNWAVKTMVPSRMNSSTLWTTTMTITGLFRGN